MEQYKIDEALYLEGDSWTIESYPDGIGHRLILRQGTMIMTFPLAGTEAQQLIIWAKDSFKTGHQEQEPS